MPEPRETVTLSTATDTYNFRMGDPIVCAWGRHGVFRRLTGWRLRWYYAEQCLVRMTRWWRPRTVCSAIDHEAGSITMAVERWSWRRWRWEAA